MLRDITIGQYFPKDSLLHRLDPRVKIVLTLCYIIMLFAASNPIGLIIGIVFLAVAYGVSGIPAAMILKSLKPVTPVIIFTAALNMFFIAGDPIWSFWKIQITVQGLWTAVVMSIRILCLIAGTSLLTYTTSPIALTDGIEQLLDPLKRFHLPVHELAMMMTIALRFIPTLIEETGGLIQRAKALIPILIPLFVSAFRRADELALAMECRCYRGGEGRTRMRRLKIQGQDIICCIITGFCIAAVIAVNLMAPHLIPM